MQASVNANLVAEIPEQDFYFVDIPNLVSGWPPAFTEKKHVVCSLLPILPLPHHAAAADISPRTNQSGDSIKRHP
jgi:hypothetical protein